MPTWLKTLVVTSIVIAMVMIVRFAIFFGITPSGNQESWGQFGDFVGGILNPLFSITGLFALLYTIALQSREMHNSTQELKASANALAKQNKHYARQQFDSNFFQLLTIHRDVADKAIVNKTHGTKAIGLVINNFRWYLDRTGKTAHSPQELVEVYDAWVGEYYGVLDNYLDSLANLVKYIYFSPVKKAARLFAYTTLSSTMTIDEVTFLLIAATFDPRQKWVRPLLEDDEFFDYCHTRIFTASELWEMFPSKREGGHDLDDGTED
ncbi:hypothetical protein [Pseudomonas congelans]|uniref:hypothetical protein n=1 Tax=Pseudomonas congelans TaxID=200452 RepID=UPI00117B2A49|nr:hypothetical protein [Pseudomonas congelans]